MKTITAPKEITLNELISKIKETLPNREIECVKKNGLTVIYTKVNINFPNATESQIYELVTLLDGQLVDTSLLKIVPVEKFKWLYSMWIVGTKVKEEE